MNKELTKGELYQLVYHLLYVVRQASREGSDAQKYYEKLGQVELYKYARYCSTKVDKATAKDTITRWEAIEDE